MSPSPSANVPSLTHKNRHATGGPDALSPADIGAVTASDLSNYAPQGLPSYAGLASPAYRFDPARCTYGPGRLRVWEAAKARVRAGTGKATVVVLGDSTAAGYPATPGTSDWPARLSQILATRGLPQASEFIPCWNGTGVANPRITAVNWTPLTPAMTVQGNQTTADLIYAASTKTSLATSRFYLIAKENFQTAANGGGPTNVTVSTPDTAFRTTAVAITAGSASNFIGIGRTAGSAGAGLFVAAAEIDVASSGVRVVNLGVGGAQSATSFGNAIFQGTTPLLLTALTPDIVVIGYGLNDHGTGATALATYKTNITAGIAMAQAAGADVLLICENDTFDSATGIPLSSYWGQQYGLADLDGVQLLDISARWGAWASANSRGLMAAGSDGAYHPSVTGYADYAAAVADAIA